jgi:hypothetical protein
VTEAEWLACADPTKMLLSVKHRRTMRKRVKQRKQRLFAVACCRRLRPLLDDERSRHCFEVVERFADDRATTKELRAAEMEARELWLHNAADRTAFACLLFCVEEAVDGLHVSTTAISAVFRRQQTDANKPFDPLDGRRSSACTSEERAQCVLVRDIFLNPFRRAPSVDPAWLAWRGGVVRELAQATYEERRLPDGTLEPERLSALTDALEETGCGDAELLDHLRSPGPHVRGCWALDLILGKS